MSLRGLKHAIIESFIGIRRNGLMSIATVGTTALSFVILGSFLVLAFGLNSVACTLLRECEIGVYPYKTASRAEVAKIQSQIRTLPHIVSVELIPKETAWEQMKKDLGEHIRLSGVEGNPLPDKLRVKLDHPRYTVSTATAIRDIPGVEDVVEASNIVNQLVRFADLVKVIGIAAAGGLFLVTAFIISNTIRLTVHARRREIRIMQLVGATNWFIRLPLVFEGMILGATGGIIAFLLIHAGVHYVTESVVRAMPLFARFSTDLYPAQLLVGLAVLGCIVGAAGSTISIRRFLNA